MSDPDVSLDVLVGQVARTFARISALPDYRHEYVVFGSAVLWLHGIRETIGDVDVFVSPRIWGALADDGWTVCTPRPDDPSFLELDLAPHPSLHVFFDWTSRDEWLSVPRCFEVAENVRGVQCVTLEEVAQHKRESFALNEGDPRHEKHRDDLAALERMGLVYKPL